MSEVVGANGPQEFPAPGNASGTTAVLSVIVLVLDLAAIAAAILAMLFYVPRFEQTFAEMNVALPGLTIFFLNVSHSSFAGLLLTLLALGLIIKELFIESPGLRLGLNVAAGVLLALFLCAGFAAFYLPLVKIQAVMGRS